MLVWSPAGHSLYTFGGRRAGGALVDELWQYSRTANSWSLLSPATSPPARNSGGMVWSMAADGMYLFGGRNDSTSGSMSIVKLGAS